MKYTIPLSEQDNVMTSFWIMLRECETHADNNDDVVLKHWVVCWYNQWNEITGSNNKPIWETR